MTLINNQFDLVSSKSNSFGIVNRNSLGLILVISYRAVTAAIWTDGSLSFKQSQSASYISLSASGYESNTLYVHIHAFRLMICELLVYSGHKYRYSVWARSSQHTDEKKFKPILRAASFLVSWNTLRNTLEVNVSKSSWPCFNTVDPRLNPITQCCSDGPCMSSIKWNALKSMDMPFTHS